MNYTYMQAVGEGFPGVQCHAAGDGSVYEDIVWDAGLPLPSKETLDSWIASNQNRAERTLSKFQFRKLFTMMERVAYDNAQSNPNIPQEYKALLLTMENDMEVADIIDLDLSDLQQGVMMLEQIGIIGTGRAAQVLANTPPTA